MVSRFFALGIGIYFSLEKEPSFVFSFLFLVLSIFLLHDTKKTPFRYGATLIFLILLGFNITKIRTYSVSENSIKIRSKKIWIAGKIQNIYLNERNKYKIVLDKIYIPSFETWQTPKKINLFVPQNDLNLSVGDYIKTEAQLVPLQNKNSIYSQNFARNLYFEKIGGIGYSKTPPTVSFKTKQTTFNQKISKKLKNILKPSEYGITKALIFGDTKEIHSSITENYRIAGISSHLLAISGLHLGLISFFIFNIFRFLCSLIPPIALNFNTKKISAILTLFFTFFYLKISNFPLSACRAYIMLTFIMIAILLNRKALSIANVAWASIIILCIKPEALLSISFQLSFSAVFGLISFSESKYSSQIKLSNDTFNKIFQSILNIVIYSLIAIFFTLSVTLYHFNIFTTYSLIGNLLSTWIMGFWIMPSLLMGMLFFNFPFSTFIFKFSAIGISFITRTTQYISNLPQNSFIFPQIPLWGLIIGIFGLLWLGIWTSKNRFIGIFFLALSLFSPILTNHPDIYLSNNNVVFRINKKLFTPSFSRTDYRTDTWLKEIAQSKIQTLDCYKFGCSIELKNKKIFISAKKKYDKYFCEKKFDLKILHPKSKCQNSITKSIDQTKLIFISGKKITTKIPGNDFRPWHPSYPKVFLH